MHSGMPINEEWRRRGKVILVNIVNVFNPSMTSRLIWMRRSEEIWYGVIYVITNIGLYTAEHNKLKRRETHGEGQNQFHCMFQGWKACEGTAT